MNTVTTKGSSGTSFSEATKHLSRYLDCNLAHCRGFQGMVKGERSGFAWTRPHSTSIRGRGQALNSMDRRRHHRLEGELERCAVLQVKVPQFAHDDQVTAFQLKNRWAFFSRDDTLEQYFKFLHHASVYRRTLCIGRVLTS